MAMARDSKYALLPDIDSAPDVYESLGCHNVENVDLNIPNLSSKDIETKNLNAQESISLFTEYIQQQIYSNDDEIKTIDDLKFVLDLTENELKSTKINTSEMTLRESVDNANQLIKSLEQIKFTSKSDPKETQEQLMKYELYYNPNKLSRASSSVSDLIQLEKRVASLEKKIGFDTFYDQTTLSERFSLLEQRIKLLLEPDYLNSVKERCSVVMDDLERLNRRYQKYINSSSTNVLDAKLQTLDQDSLLLHQTVERLNVLAEYHKKSINELNESSAVREQVEHLKIRADRVEGTLESLSKAMEEGQRQVNENLKVMGERIAKLLEKK